MRVRRWRSSLGGVTRAAERRDGPGRVRHPRLQPGERLLRRVDQISVWRAVRLVVTAAVTIVIIAAIAARVVEPHVFPSIGVALWWAVVTVGTVGYGDVVPTSPAGRGVAAATILFSMAFIPTLTSLVVAALVRRLQRDQDLADQSRFEEIASRLARIEAQLDRQARQDP
jgi:voltage-gated potassium channel